MKTFRFNDFVFEYEDDFNLTIESATRLIESRMKSQAITENTAKICEAVTKSIESIGDNIAKANSWRCYDDPVSGVEHIDFYENQDQNETKK